MNGKNAAYFCCGTVLGIVGTVAFLWFWEEPQAKNDIPKTEPQELPKPVDKNITVDKSSIDDKDFDAGTAVNYAAIATKLYGGSESDDIPNVTDGPKRITDADALAEAGRYDTIELTLYSDGILANSVTDEVMSESDIFVALGPNYMPRDLRRIFERGIDDSLDEIFIRNDNLYVIYEIVTDTRTYREVVGGDNR